MGIIFIKEEKKNFHQIRMEKGRKGEKARETSLPLWRNQSADLTPDFHG